VYVATENDSLYAIDAGNGTVYWRKNYIPGGQTPSDDNCGSGNITGGIGITGTPVIDTATNTIYFVTSTKQSGVAYYQGLHAVDVTSGLDKVTPALVAGSYGGHSL
jgi:outer membrane protein assembly factor BamB